MAQALSLRCADCGTQLKSVAECQAHGELTGHSNFEESTEKVLNLTCTACGKPCRSQTEVDLHTKRTGHDQFVDKTDEVKAMDTEAEMKAASDAQREELGLPPRAAAAEGSDTKMEDVEMVEPEVDKELQKQLEDMGFSANKAIRALHFTGTSNVEQAVGWIVEHGDDKDIDEPLLIPKEEKKPQLSPEEARKQAEELVRKAKEKREREEAEMEKLREKERIRAGKELQAAKKLEEELALRRRAEERAREKAEEARAREKIRLKLAEDKKERRRKLGLPEEASPEELEKERQMEEEKRRKADAGKLKLPPRAPIGLAEKLRASLVEMKKGAGDDAAKSTTAFTTLLKYVSNIASNPGEDKFRRIKLSNAAFQSRVACLPGALPFLETLGFQKDETGEVLVMPAEKASLEALNAAGKEIQNAISNPFFGAL